MQQCHYAQWPQKQKPKVIRTHCCELGFVYALFFLTSKVNIHRAKKIVAVKCKRGEGEKIAIN